MVWKKWTLSLILLLVFFASSWAVLWPGFFRVHDFTHAARIVEMTTALSEGQFPVRWVKNLGFGYGMPLYEFYAPLPYYLGAALYWLGLDAVLTIKFLYLFCSLLTLLGAYKLGASLYGRAGGIITAAALTLAPYRAVNLYVRGALSEAWGIMALPWILYGLVLVMKRRRSGWLILVLALATLLLSHNLTALMFVPLSGLFALLYWSINSRQLKLLLTMAGSYLLALGLSAFYWWPALTENHFTKINSILTGYFAYNLHFLYIRQFIKPFWGYGGSGWGPDDGISFFLGFGQLLGLTLLLWLVVKKSWRLIRNMRYELRQIGFALGMLILLAFSLFMSLGRSELIWQAIPTLTFIQFPWRWLSVAILFLALLNGLAVNWLSGRTTRLAVTTGLLIVLLANAYFFRPESFTAHPEDIYYTDPLKIQTQMSSILPDYIPIQMSQDLTPPSQPVVVSGGHDQNLTVLVDRGQQKLISLEQGPARTVTFSVADFPGWQSYLDAAKVEHSAGPLGQIQVEVPAGAHQVGINWESTPIRHWSDWLSVLSLLVFLYLALPNWLTKKVKS